MSVAEAKILIVDDVAENRDLLERRLQRLGIVAIDQAGNGIEALAAIDKTAYDLMLLDLMMPEMDGFQVIEKLHADGKKDLPIIIISAMTDMDSIVRCVEAGAEDFLLKPLNPTLLRARVLSSLEKKRLRDLTREELRRKQSELNEARTLQLALAPPPLKHRAAGIKLDLDVVLQPAKEVGGDLVDHFFVGDLLVFLVGDVSDKGAGAALMMARTHTLFRSLAARPDAAALFRDPARAMNSINDTLAAGNSNCMFVTLFIGVLSLSDRRLAYVRAGHVPPFRRFASGEATRIGDAGGPPLGLVEGLAYKQHETTLALGERLLVVTDGFTEANDGNDRLFGDERVNDLFTRQSQLTLAEMVAEVRAYEGEHQYDDMAAVLLSIDNAADLLEIEVRPSAEGIVHAVDRISEFLEAQSVEQRPVHHTGMLVEELLTNIGTHGAAADKPATVSVFVEADRVVTEILDRGLPFDPRLSADPDLSVPAQDRAVGGLGLFLVRKLSAALDYRTDDGQNRTRFSLMRADAGTIKDADAV
jgi:sigma-B regulation protein RsbU (phosphoserine phosphatase)